MNVVSRFSLSTRSFATGMLVVMAMLSARPAFAADTVLNYDGATTGVSGRLIIPCIKIALASRGDQRGVTTSAPGTFGPTLSASGVGGSFSLKVSVTDENGQGIRLFPPGPCKDGTCQNVNVLGVADDGTHLLFHFAISSPNGRLDPGSVVGFNPQPEPPGDFVGDNAMIVNFGIGDAPAATVSAALLVINQSTGRVVTIN